MFAKVSYQRLGRVDLDAIWHWREMQSCPESYNLSEDDVLPCPEVARARQGAGLWCHQPGDEWLAANPVETPESYTSAASCFVSVDLEYTTQLSPACLLGLPAELIDHILSFLEEEELCQVAASCRRLRCHTQSFFKALAIEHLGWLWEIFEAEQYPTSPDWPATWDPCNPPGFAAPDLPYDLPSEEQEEALWTQIVEDDPDMESVGNAAKAFNRSRREAILGPHRARTEQSIGEWREFRERVANWICRLPLDKDRVVARGLDWARLWRLFHPNTTQIPGIRNRARIWTDCQRIVDYMVRLRNQGAMDAKNQVVRELISDNEDQWWHHALQTIHDPHHNGFLRPVWQGD